MDNLFFSFRTLLWLAVVFFYFVSLDNSYTFWFGRKTDLKENVVKIYATYQKDNFLFPWQAGMPGQGSGSGFIIKGRKILTNAHVVSNVRFLEVQREGNTKRYAADILFIAHDCDLALLTVKDEEFFGSLRDADAIQLADELPDLNEEVIVMGYPMGGERISITKGIVSRIDYGVYAHSGIDSHLMLQVDAAINPGNSGGPVFYKNKAIGVAFQGIPGSQNIGYAIPIQVIKHFLADVSDGKYDGYPELGVDFRPLINPALRRKFGLTEPYYGIAISLVDPFGGAAGYIFPGDILLSIDKHPIFNDGTVKIDGQQLLFFEVLERKLYGDTVDFQLLRDGNLHKIQIELTNKNDPFIFRFNYDKKPPYFILGGLIFTPLSKDLFVAIGRPNLMNIAHLDYLMHYVKIDDLYKDRTEFVVLVGRLPHSVNTYADTFIMQVLESVNGIKIGSLSDIQVALEKAKDNFHVLKFLNKDEELVLDAKAVSEADKQIQLTYRLPSLYRFSD